jgi:hypothetical protein
MLIKVFLALPICALAVYFAIVQPRIPLLLQAGLAVLLFAATIAFWDHRSPAQLMLEEERPPPEIIQLINQHGGEVFWVDGRGEAWFLFGRPQWASPLQGIPTIFSPALANEWRRRTQFLMGLKLADQKSFAPWSTPERKDPPLLSQGSVRQLCARTDAPAWIIAPLEYGADAPASLEMTLWRLPKPLFKLTKADGDYAWQRIDAYGVIPCAGQEQPQPER